MEKYINWLNENEDLSYDTRRSVINAWHMSGQITLREASELMEIC